MEPVILAESNIDKNIFTTISVMLYYYDLTFQFNLRWWNFLLIKSVKFWQNVAEPKTKIYAT